MQSPKAEAGDAAQRALDLPLLVPPEKIVLVMADMEEAFTRWQPGAWKPLAEEPGPAFEAKLAQALVEAMEGDSKTVPPTPGYLYGTVLPKHDISYKSFMGSLSQYLQKPPSKEVQATVGTAWEKLIAHVRAEHKAVLCVHALTELEGVYSERLAATAEQQAGEDNAQFQAKLVKELSKVPRSEAALAVKRAHGITSDDIVCATGGTCRFDGPLRDRS